MNIRLGLGAVLLGASLMVGGAASAATCAAAYTSNVTGNAGDANPLTNTNSGCFLGSTNNDTLNPLQVNTDGAFAPGAWTFGGKVLENGVTSSGVFSIGSANVTGGTWSVASNFFSQYSELLIVLKGGNGNINPDDYVAYLIRAVDGVTGSYATPFKNANNGNAATISHISYYVRGNGNGGGGGVPTVPLPAGMPLMLAGLGAMAFVARRKARKA